ncbi:MAG: hypothetical protein JO122_13955 [Acetobacteraceae bacterium]|nr:hypothetical protein [Acetobacteraceae bacterium]
MLLADKHAAISSLYHADSSSKTNSKPSLFSTTQMLSSKLTPSKSTTYATPGDEIRPSLFNLGLVKDATAAFSQEAMHAAHPINGADLRGCDTHD